MGGYYSNSGPLPDDATTEKTIVGRIVEHARRQPEASALVHRGAHVSYAELGQLALSVAKRLCDSGVTDGDRVLLSASSTPAFVVCYLAVHLSGAVAVPVDAGMSAQRIAFIRDRVTAKLQVTPPEQDACLQEAREGLSLDSQRDLSWVGPRSEDLADIMFTSGTTGAPKGVMLSHRNLGTGASQINRVLGTERDDVEVLALPLAHSFGLGSLRCLLSQGACAVLVEGFAFPVQIFDAMDRYCATGFRCVPSGLATMFRVSGDKLGEFASTLRYVELGSARMPLTDKERLMRLLPRTRLFMHYGLTEATRSVFIDFHRDSERLDSIGKPAPGVDLKIVGERGSDPPGRGVGEICIKGGHVMDGYWDDSEQTAKVLDGGWLHTGDSGYMGDDGYLYLVGRRDDLINVGGRKVSPVEVEDALRTHDAVADCACVGIADPQGLSGEAVAMLIVPESGREPSEKELRGYLRDLLEPYKLPSQWLVGGRIPYTHNGKVQRHVVREKFTTIGREQI